MQKSSYVHILGSKALQVSTSGDKFDVPYTPDLPDHAAVMSLPAVLGIDPGLAKGLADLVATDLSTRGGNFKMFITVANEWKETFDADVNYRCAGVSRLMINAPINPEEEKVIVSSRFDPTDKAKINIDTKPETVKKYAQDIAVMLQADTYWHKEEGCSTEKAIALIDSATESYVMTYEGKPIAFGRLIHDGHTGYLSDVVVAKEYQGRGFGTYLNECIYSIDMKSLNVTTLVRGTDQRDDASDEENAIYKDYARFSEAVYQKCGFVYSDDEGNAHKVVRSNETLYFRYIKHDAQAQPLVEFRFMEEDQQHREKESGKTSDSAHTLM